MRKHIGTKIVTMIIVMLIIFEGTCGINMYSMYNINRNVKAQSEEMKKLSDTYLEIQKTRSDMLYYYDNLKLYANLIALLPIKEATDGMSSEAQETIDNFNAKLDELEQLVDKTGNKELMDSFKAYKEQILPVADILQTVSQMYQSGEEEGMLGSALSINDMVTPIDDSNAVFLENLDKATQDCQARVLECSQKSEKAVNVMIVLVLVAMIVFVAVIVTSIIVVMKSIAAPAKKASKHLSVIIDKIDKAEGDLTERIHVSTKDEVGQLVSGVNEFMGQLQNVMKTIQEDSTSISESVSQLYEHVNESNENATSVSAVMEELAASMQEVSHTVETISNNTVSVQEETQAMAEGAIEGSDLVGEIKSRAENVREDTVTSKENTSAMISNIKEVLEASIEESKSVEKIEELTGDILDISSQTNLLALNASIEAARAGEAGKGFAVVADEIRVLADNSRDTANNIQQISTAVMEAVKKLAENANEMIQFINTTVLTDYEKFVGVADQYHADADSIEEIILKFADSAKSLAATMDEVTRGIEGITVSVDESAKGVSSAAESTSMFVEATSSIQEEINNNRIVANQLKEQVDKFKKI